MKRNTRLEILQTAKSLFNEKGFNAVSTRDISNALGISKGNLSYYFKKKEEIVEAILTEFPSSQPDAPQTMEELNAFFLDMQQVVQENAFYFWHHAQLSQLSSVIKAQQNQVYHNNVVKLRTAFEIFHEDGYLQEEGFEGQYEQTIDTLLLSSIYWLPFCSLKMEEIPQKGFQYKAWTILFPLLTESGKRELKGIIKL